MAKKYIDANSLIERFKKLETTSLFNKTIYALIANMLAAQPTADVQEIRHGRWEQIDDTKCKCSNCGIIAFIVVYPSGNKNYCFNCGARMDGDNNV